VIALAKAAHRRFPQQVPDRPSGTYLRRDHFDNFIDALSSRQESAWQGPDREQWRPECPPWLAR